MMLSGFTFVRNAVQFDYPVVESISSALPVVDELVVAVGDSEDGTLDLIESIGDPKVKIVKTSWDDSLREGGRVLAQQTDTALAHTRGDWSLYLQADEVLHEDCFRAVLDAAGHYLNDSEVEGFLFRYLHFYGSYHTYFDGRPFYPREVRIVRNGIGVSSWRDAQGFRRKGRKLRVVEIDAQIYHYGWVRSPGKMLEKQRNLDRYWHDDGWLSRRYEEGFEIYSNLRGLKYFTGSHPKVMRERIEKADWEFNPPEEKLKLGAMMRLRRWFEEKVSRRPIGEYRNYILLKR